MDTNYNLRKEGTIITFLKNYQNLFTSLTLIKADQAPRLAPWNTIL